MLENPVVPLDGIISSPDYFTEVVRAGRELDYAADLGVRYLIVSLPPDYQASAPVARTGDWATLYLQRMSEARDLAFVEVAREAYADDGHGWALLRMERD